jgi:hypothetical protein
LQRLGTALKAFTPQIFNAVALEITAIFFSRKLGFNRFNAFNSAIKIMRRMINKIRLKLWGGRGS